MFVEVVNYIVDFVFVDGDMMWDFYCFDLLFCVYFFEFGFEFVDEVVFIVFCLFVVWLLFVVGFCVVVVDGLYRVRGMFEVGFEFVIIDVVLLVFVDGVWLELFVEFYDDNVGMDVVIGFVEFVVLGVLFSDLLSFEIVDN